LEVLRLLGIVLGHFLVDTPPEEFAKADCLIENIKVPGTILAQSGFVNNSDGCHGISPFLCSTIPLQAGRSGIRKNIPSNLISSARTLFLRQISQPLPLCLLNDCKGLAYQFGKDTGNQRERTTMRGIMIGPMNIEDKSTNIAQ
jgi:hypothetical protein